MCGVTTCVCMYVYVVTMCVCVCMYVPQSCAVTTGISICCAHVHIYIHIHMHIDMSFMAALQECLFMTRYYMLCIHTQCTHTYTSSHVAYGKAARVAVNDLMACVCMSSSAFSISSRLSGTVLALAW